MDNGSPPVVVSLPLESVPPGLGPEPGSCSRLRHRLGHADGAKAVTAQPQPDTVLSRARARPSRPPPAGIPHPPCSGGSRPTAGQRSRPISGGTNDTLTIASTTIGQNGDEYEAVFSNGTAPDATTNPALLTVTPHVAPSITLQPTDQTGVPGDTVSFTATASGEPDPTVVWQVSSDGGTTWSDIDGNGTSTSDNLRGEVFGTFENGWEVQAVFTNDAGSATTNPATLTVSAPSAPTVTLQPTDQASHPGDTVSFTATASGDPDPTVVWQVSSDGGTAWSNIQFNGTSTSDQLSGEVFGTFENGWEVRAVFTNGAGSATTNPATLTVT